MGRQRFIIDLCVFATLQACILAAAVGPGFGRGDIPDEPLPQDDRGDIPEETVPPSNACGKADIYFVLDQSNSIWEENMIKAKKFIANVTGQFPISPNDFQVGVISFAEQASNRINLNEYSSKEPLQNAIIGLRRIHGASTATHEGLRMLREKMNSHRAGARMGVAKLAVLITDGSSSEPHKMAREAALVHESNITMFAIGLPDRYNKANMTELKIIASDPDSRYVFMVDDWNALDSIKLTISNSICNAVELPPTQKPSPTTPKPTTTQQPTTTTPEPTTKPSTAPPTTKEPSTAKPTTTEASTPHPSTTAQPITVNSTKKPELPPKTQPEGCRRTDIIFIPSETANPLELNIVSKFIGATTKALDFTGDKFRIGVLPQECHSWDGFEMGQFTDLQKIVNKIDSMKFRLPDTARQLMRMRYKFNATDAADDQDGRVVEGIRRVAVLFLDQKSVDLEETIKQARHAQEKGVEIFVFAVGKNYSQAEAEMIASLHSSQHLTTVESYSQLPYAVKKLAKLLSVCPRVC